MFGSEADIDNHSGDVRYSPENRHRGRPFERPLSAKSRHYAVQQKAAYSITSSARASRVWGTTSPNVLAVCRLMTSSNLVARRTGRLAGLSPLRMRPL